MTSFLFAHHTHIYTILIAYGHCTYTVLHKVSVTCICQLHHALLLPLLLARFAALFIVLTDTVLS